MRIADSNDGIIWSTEMDDKFARNQFEDTVTRASYGDEEKDFDKWLELNAEELDNDYWQMASENLSDYIFPKIEKQCRDNQLILLGVVGRWSGNATGGKIIEAEEDDFRETMSDYDRIDIVQDADKNLGVVYYHHDGEHIMKLYTLPEDTTALAKACGYDDKDEFESDLLNDYLGALDLADHTELLVPIKNLG